jgi:quinol monooxygenase YgiN
MSDPKLILVAEVHGLAGRADELRELLDALADGSRGEPGCASFRVLCADDIGEFVLISNWIQQDALESHYATPHYRRYRAAVTPLLARPSDVTVHYVSSTVRPVDPNPPDPGLLG